MTAAFMISSSVFLHTPPFIITLGILASVLVLVSENRSNIIERT